MDAFPISPSSEGGGTLTPKQAADFFEFFKSGSHREVLLLGELIEQPVHYVKSKGHKVLCGARQGLCELCEVAGQSENVSTQQVEYYAATFVRSWKEREFHQRVCVFSAAAESMVRRLVPECRGQRISVLARKQGTSVRYDIEPMAGLPRGFPLVLPAAFDVLPFIRARFGKRQDPARPLLCLPSFKCEPTNARPAGRPKPLDLSAEDSRTDPDELAKMKATLAQKLASWQGAEPDPATPTPTAAAVQTPRPAAPSPRPQPTPTEPGLAEAGQALGAVMGRLIPGFNAEYGPKVPVRQPITEADEHEALTKRAGSAVCDTQRGRSTFLNGKKGGGM
jgi:hypothetical protein